MTKREYRNSPERTGWPIKFCNEISRVFQEYPRYFPGVFFAETHRSSTIMICFIIGFDLFQFSK